MNTSLELGLEVRVEAQKRTPRGVRTDEGNKERTVSCRQARSRPSRPSDERMMGSELFPTALMMLVTTKEGRALSNPPKEGEGAACTGRNKRKKPTSILPTLPWGGEKNGLDAPRVR